MILRENLIIESMETYKKKDRIFNEEIFYLNRFLNTLHIIVISNQLVITGFEPGIRTTYYLL